MIYGVIATAESYYFRASGLGEAVVRHFAEKGGKLIVMIVSPSFVLRADLLLDSGRERKSRVGTSQFDEGEETRLILDLNRISLVEEYPGRIYFPGRVDVTQKVSFISNK